MKYEIPNFSCLFHSIYFHFLVSSFVIEQNINDEFEQYSDSLHCSCFFWIFVCAYRVSHLLS